MLNVSNPVWGNEGVMETQIDVQEVTRSPGSLLAHVRQGDEVTLTESGTPIAKVIPIKPQPRQRGGYGAFKGQIQMSDDFNDSLSETELREWEK